MNTVLDNSEISDLLHPLTSANAAFDATHPGPRLDRQPVHTVFGGAQLFVAESAQKIGDVALRYMDSYAPDFIAFAHAFQLPGSAQLPMDGEAKSLLLIQRPDRLENRAAWLAHTVYDRVVAKLKTEPVEDFRIDFEDGFGVRSRDEEHHAAVQTALEVAEGFRKGILPPFIGIRIKSLSQVNAERAIETLNVFLGSLLDASDGKLPENFVVTLPKVTVPKHVEVISNTLDAIENRLGLPPHSIGLELMIETPTSVLTPSGQSAIPALVAVARGRCTGVHFGVYDYTASLEISAGNQKIQHPACDFARHVMQVSMAGTGVWISDGATNILPIPLHKPTDEGTGLTPEQIRENVDAVHRSWRIGFGDIYHSLSHGYYQGWDLHPGQLPVRYAAIYSFFLDALDVASLRLRTFVEKAAQATLVGDVFDDAATGQGLLNFFLRAINCGAITKKEAAETGLTMEEIATRSFVQILERRSTQATTS